MTTRELYSSIGVSGYEHEGCWRKDGIFQIRMEAPPSCHKCPKCGNREVIHHVCKDNVCVAVGINLSLANSGDHAINSGKTKAEGESPWPNSFHPGGICVSFADGRAQFLSQDIAGRVYYNLMTPQGIRLNGTDLDGGVLSDNEY